MIESPPLQELKDEWTAEGRADDVLQVLEARFGQVPADIGSAVRSTRDEARLKALLTEAVRCPDLVSFRCTLSG